MMFNLDDFIPWRHLFPKGIDYNQEYSEPLSMSDKQWKKRKRRNKIAKESRRRNRQ